MRTKYSEQKQMIQDVSIEPGVRRFLRTVKANLGSTFMNEAQSKAVLKNAESIENGLLDWIENKTESRTHADPERRVHMDYLLHHRLELAKEIAVSFANGRNLSHRRRKVLENSIDYLEENLR